MGIPRRLHGALKRPAKVVATAAVATAGAGVSDAPATEVSMADASEAEKQPAEKWRDGRRGFLDTQLRNESQMARYNQHLVITTLRRGAIGAALAATSATGYLIRESETGPGKIALVVILWLAAITAVVAMARLARSGQGSTEETAGEPKREAEQAPHPKSGENGDQAGHRAPDQH